MGKYTRLFIDETRRHLASLGKIVASLADAEPAGDLFFEGSRLSHSIKGMALFEEQQEIADLSYALERGFERIHGGGVDGAVLDAIGDGLALLAAMIDEVESGGTAVSDPAQVISRIE